MPDNLFISCIIGLLALDTTIAFQVMISQPIFSCSILGWLFGDFVLGAETGIMLQLIWLSFVPAGAVAFPESNVGAMVTCTFILQFDVPETSHLVFTTAFFIGLIAIWAGSHLTVLHRKLNNLTVHLMSNALEKVQFSRISLLTFASILRYFLLMSLMAYGFLEIGGSLLQNIQISWYTINAKLAYVRPAVWGLGIGITSLMIFRAWRERRQNKKAAK